MFFYKQQLIFCQGGRYVTNIEGAELSASSLKQCKQFIDLLLEAV